MTTQQRHIIDRVEAKVRQILDGQMAGHGIDHALRVLKTARTIQAEVGGDLFVIELAVWLHDVGDAKFHAGVERSAQMAVEILSALDVSTGVIQRVAHIVDNISFRKGAAAEKLSLEGQIVQDADRLDALGAVGIVRTIEYGAAIGQPFHVPGGEGKGPSGVAHFYQKLFKLQNLLNSEPARRIAGQREQFMRAFLKQYFDECGQEDHA